MGEKGAEGPLLGWEEQRWKVGRDRLFWISDFFFCILIIKASCPGTWDPKEWGGHSSSLHHQPYTLPEAWQGKNYPGKVEWGQEHQIAKCFWGGRN